jgi:putative acetyltransferase
MISIVRTNNNHPDFKILVQALDAELLDRYGEKQAAYAPYNVLDLLQTAVLAYDNDIVAGCACFKKFDEHTVEVKRMFVFPAHRGRHIAAMILSELHTWAKELSYTHAVLETANRQPEAIALYQKAGYQLIENYGQYAGMKDSICIKKTL